MDDLQGKISEILSDPQALQQIKSLGNALGLGENETGNTSKGTASPGYPQDGFPASQGAQGDILNGLSSLGGDNLNMITKLMPLLSSLNKEDETTHLLDAVAPFLSKEKREKVEKAKKMVQLLRVLPLLRSGGLF